MKRGVIPAVFARHELLGFHCVPALPAVVRFAGFSLGGS